MLKAGWCAVDITPPVGTPLAGFAARKGVSEGIHDPLMARALVIEREGGETVALLTADVVGVPTPMARQVRERIAAAIGTAPDHVMVSASHTHSGPVLEHSLDTIGLASEHYRATLADDARRGGGRRREAAGAGRLEAASGRIEGIGRNRRHDDGLPVDPEVGLLSLLPSSGPACRFVKYACHAVTLGPDNLLITADYPGYAMRFIERVMGPGTVAMFANGAAGDVNTGHSADLSALGYFIPGRTFERAERLGTMLGAEVVRIAQMPEVESDPVVRAASREVLLPAKALPSIARGNGRPRAEAEGPRRPEREARQRSPRNGSPAGQGEGRRAVRAAPGPARRPAGGQGIGHRGPEAHPGGNPGRQDRRDGADRGPRGALRRDRAFGQGRLAVEAHLGARVHQRQHGVPPLAGGVCRGGLRGGFLDLRTRRR